MLRLLFLLVVAGPVCGQTLPDTAQMNPMLLAYKPTQLTKGDTVRALHRLYGGSRAGGVVLTVLAGLAIGISYAAVPPASNQPYNGLWRGVIDFILPTEAKVGFTIALPLGGAGIHLQSAYSKRKEAETVFNYTEKRFLLPEIEAKLRPVHFQMPPSTAAPR